jgi:hypothetical protein
MIDEQRSKVHETGMLEAQFTSVELDRDSYRTENEYERHESFIFFTSIISCQLSSPIERLERVHILVVLVPLTPVTPASLYRLLLLS